MAETIINVIFNSLFHASILFLVASGLQLVFGVQKIFNLACGSFYALGAYLGIVFYNSFLSLGGPPALIILPLLLAGLVASLIGPIIEKGLLRYIYKRDETFQILLTFAVVLMIEDVIKFFWGTGIRQTAVSIYVITGKINFLGATVPIYNLMVIAASLTIAGLMGYMIVKTRFGRTMRATAANSEMSEAIGVNISLLYLKVFTIGTLLGTVGGALVIPTIAGVSEMALDQIIVAFAVVVIGGLGSMKGAVIGALMVGVVRSIAMAIYPELDLLLIYLIVIMVLVFKPQGLYGTAS